MVKEDRTPAGQVHCPRVLTGRPKTQAIACAEYVPLDQDSQSQRYVDKEGMPAQYRPDAG